MNFPDTRPADVTFFTATDNFYNPNVAAINNTLRITIESSSNPITVPSVECSPSINFAFPQLRGSTFYQADFIIPEDWVSSGTILSCQVLDTTDLAGVPAVVSVLNNLNSITIGISIEYPSFVVSF